MQLALFCCWQSQNALYLGPASSLLNICCEAHLHNSICSKLLSAAIWLA
jgi:hypothetical protein